MKNKLLNLILILVFLAGLSLLLYPTVSNYWNSIHQSQVIVDYTERVDQMELEKQSKLRQEARAFNEELLERSNPFALSPEQQVRYEAILDPSETGVMGYLEIPSINVTLPIEHGTDDAVLDQAVGHLVWSSLPVGGESTHCVLSGHRGLPSAELLTNIDHMEVGDVFYLHVLGEKLEYRVDNIAVVEPTDLSLLGVDEGKDYVTLLTCTPYGINSHRLLVRGVRVVTEAEESGSFGTTIQSEGELIPSVYPTFVLLLTGLTVVFLTLVLTTKVIKKPLGGSRLKKPDEEITDETTGSKTE